MSLSSAPGHGVNSPRSAQSLADRILEISGCPLALVALADGRGDWSWSLRGQDSAEEVTGPNRGATGSGATGSGATGSGATELETSCPGTAALALHTLLHRRPWVVVDTLQDPLVGLHPAVVGTPWVRRLVGVPVLAGDGRVLGCLCAIDFEPRPFRPELLQTLEAMATGLAHILERQEIGLRLRQLRRCPAAPSPEAMPPQPGRPESGGPWLLSRQVCLQGLKALFRLGAAEDIALLRLECLAVEGYVTAMGVEGLAVLMDAVAEGIRAVLPPQASFCRFAEEEFLLLVPQVPDLASLSALAARLVSEVSAAPYRIGNDTLAVALAVGASLLDGSQPNLGSALSEVGVARRLAASRPGGGFRLVDASLRRKVRDDFSRQSRFRQGLNSGALVPHFQPIVDLVSGRTRGFEALARWRTIEGEVQSPGEYLAVAQQLGLTGELDLAVIHQVLDSLPALAAAAGGIPGAAGEEGLLMSVNISAQLLEREELCEQLLAMLAAAPAPQGWRLQVEILEESMQLSDHRLDDVLSRLTALRVGVAIDDFGTGYSSLARLHTLPIQAFKIDRSFVERINDQIAPSNQLLRTMNTLAIDLGLAATAEGIGSSQQCDWLRRNGFLSGQGFHFSHPLSLDQALEHLRQQAGPPAEEATIAPVPLPAPRPRGLWRRLGRPLT